MKFLKIFFFLIFGTFIFSGCDSEKSDETTDMKSLSSIDKIIKMARAHIGKEKDINAINSITYIADIYSPEKQKLSSLKLYLKKPYLYKEESIRDIPNTKEFEKDGKMIKSEKMTVKTTVFSNGNEGSIIIENLTTGLVDIQVLTADKVFELKTLTAINLDFFDRKSKDVKNAKELPEEKLNNEVVLPILYEYKNNVGIVRYFKKSTKELTAIKIGESIVFEAGDKIKSNGILFYNAAETFVDNKKIYTTNFSEIRVNDNLSDDFFKCDIVKTYFEKKVLSQ